MMHRKKNGMRPLNAQEYPLEMEVPSARAARNKGFLIFMLHLETTIGIVRHV